MRYTDLGSFYNVAVSESDIDRFNDSWPASELRGLRGVTFQFDKRNGDLIDIHFKNGNADRWDGGALLALSQDAQSYARSKQRLNDNPSSTGWVVTGVAAVVGLGWLLLRPKKASAAPKPPVAPPATGPLPKAPDPIPPPPQLDCLGKTFKQYKFAEPTPFNRLFRRLTIWDTNPANTSNDVYEDTGFLPINWPQGFSPAPTSYFDISAEQDFEKHYANAGDVPLNSTVRFLAQAWMETIDGWCLAEVNTNYEPWTSNP